MEYTFKSIFWDIKTSYFSSVILAFAITAFNRARERKEKIHKQHYTYVDAMHDFDEIFYPYLGNKLYSYMPLYCDKYLRDTLEYLAIILGKNSEIVLDQEISLHFEQAIKRLEMLELEVKSGNIISTADEYDLLYEIDISKRSINSALSMVIVSFNEISTISRNLCLVLDLLRTPWRVDVKIKEEILSRLSKNPENEIDHQFYYRMLLHGHSFNEVNK